MRKNWVEPQIQVQKFVANEYVAACGDSGTVYKFTCDAGGGRSGDVYLETNNIAGLQTDGKNPDQHLSRYHACKITHEAESTDAFLEGYYVADSQGGPNHNQSATSVIVWRGPNNNNTHCTKNLDINSWETAKS